MSKNNYKITMAEFKGKTLAHLENIEKDVVNINGKISEIEVGLKDKANVSDIKETNRRIDNIKIVSAVIGGIGGIISSILAFLGFRRV